MTISSCSPQESMDKLRDFLRLRANLGFTRRMATVSYEQTDFADCTSTHHLCGHDMQPVFLQAGHHLRAKTNNPIFGVLTQPIPRAWISNERVISNEWNTYLEASHVEWLQAGGARVVPVDYRKSRAEIQELLGQLNGLYIPGDAKDTFDNPQYTDVVMTALDWVQTHNMEEGNHFPVVGNSYGMLSMLKSQMRSDDHFKELSGEQVHEALQQNLLQHP